MGLIDVLDRYAGKILAFINGHNHCDQLFNELKNQCFPIISINCAKCEYFTEHKPEGAEVPFRRLGDRTQESFDVMNIDGENRRLKFFRFGAGRDRVVENGKAAWDASSATAGDTSSVTADAVPPSPQGEGFKRKVMV